MDFGALAGVLERLRACMTAPSGAGQRMGKAWLLLGCLGMMRPCPAAEVPNRHWTTIAYPPAFQHLSVEQGLSQSTVYCMIQDRQGFLWFGTEGGLNRYDGFRFQVFHAEKGVPNTLGDDRILHLMEDRRGYIWIATRNEGFTILDPVTMRMITVRSSEAPGGLPTRAIHALAEDGEGNVWLGTENQGLCMVSKDWRMPELPRILSFPSSVQDPAGATGRITAIHFDRQGTLWIGSLVRGLGRLVSRTGDKLSFQYFPHVPARTESSAPSIIHTIREDAFGLLWLGSDTGPFTFDPKANVFHQWKAIEGESISIANVRVRSILRDTKDNMWVASDGQGLLKVQPRARAEDPVRFQRFTQDPRDPRSLSGNGLQCVFEDRSGVLWVSAYNAGLNKLVLNPGRILDREKPSLFQFRNNAADSTSLSGNTVAAIGEDRFGNLWIGTDGSGLNRVRPPAKPGESMRFERYREDPERKPGTLHTNVILSIYLDEKKQLWLTSYNGGLIRVDQATANAEPRFTHFEYATANPEGLASNFIRCVVDDGAGGLWVAFNDNGLNHFNPKTGKAKRYGWGVGAKGSSTEAIFQMVKDAYGTLWLATPVGLNRFNPVTEEFRVYQPGGEHSLSATFVNTLHLDDMGNLWVGTSGGGLNRIIVPPWEGEEPRFTTYGIAEGLPSKVIMGILSDGKGNLCLATDRALCRFDVQEGHAHPFTWQGELRKAEFIWNARFRSTSGELFFGSNDGLTMFHPEDIASNQVIPPIAITGFQILNKPLPLGDRATQLPGDEGIQEITLSPADSSFAFEFAALHFMAPERNRYAYMMEGLDKAWNEIGTNRFVSYTALSPGDYVLRVKGSNCDGVWNEDGLRLKVRVLPPWYKTWWFRTLLVGSVLGLVYAVIRVRIQVLQHRNRLLKQLVDERTRELAQANEGLAEANEALRNQSLTDPLTGLRNRRFLYACMPEDIAQVQRIQRDVARNDISRMKQNVDVLFLMVDLDFFKRVNDEHGHHAGDLVLQQMSEILRSAVRESDTVTRWGGEEFLVVARNTARADAVILPERIRSAVEAHRFEIGEDQPVRCTCSLGFSVFPFLPSEVGTFSWEQIIDIADACLFAAKRSGRNAWVGLVPDVSALDEQSGREIPGHVNDLIKAQMFPVLTSLKTPIHWESSESRRD